MTSKYWHDRKVQYDQSLARDEKRLYSKLAAYYEREAAQLDKEIAAYYARYGVNGVLSYRNMLETLPDADKELLIEQIDAFVKRYPEYADLVPVRESIYKLNRLEGLRQSIAMQQLHMGAYEQAQALAFFQKQALRYANGAASYLGLGSSFCRIDSDLIQVAVGNRWCSGKDFSERIWDNRTKLADTLHTQVINGVIRGEDYHRLARQLREKFTQVSQKNAERLIFTEDTYLSNEAAMQVFEREAAVTEYEYVCTNDSSSCDICRGLDGQRFRISQRMPGTNFPPMHPWCRCFFDPVVPELGTFRSGKNADTALTFGADGGIIKAGSKPFIHDDKITKFLLKPGAKHYLDFEKVGYTSEYADLLKQDILNGFSENEMVEYQKNEKTGVVTFNVYMMLGKTKKKRFCTGWQIDAGSDFPRLITGFRKDR